MQTTWNTVRPVTEHALTAKQLIQLDWLDAFWPSEDAPSLVAWLQDGVERKIIGHKTARQVMDALGLASTRSDGESGRQFHA